MANPPAFWLWLISHWNLAIWTSQFGLAHTFNDSFDAFQDQSNYVRNARDDNKKRIYNEKGIVESFKLVFEVTLILTKEYDNKLRCWWLESNMGHLV